MNTNSSNNSGLSEIQKRMGYLWVTLPEIVTLENCSAVETHIIRRLEGKVDRVAFDLSNMHHVYSTALGILIRIRKLVNEQGGIVCLVNVPAHVGELLAMLNLDKIFPMYTTDVEFEISQDEVWRQRLSERSIDFRFTESAGNNPCRISICGEMVSGYDMVACRMFVPGPGAKTYVIDLTELSAVDSEGAGVFMSLLDRIQRAGGKCVAYGACEAVWHILKCIGAEQYVTLCADEKEACAPS